MLQLLYVALPPLDDKAVNIFLHLNTSRNTLLYFLIYCLSCPAVRVPVMSSRRWGTVAHSHGLQQSAVDNAIDGERVFPPAYEPKEDILSSDNILIEWAVIEAVKQCSKFVECVLQGG